MAVFVCVLVLSGASAPARMLPAAVLVGLADTAANLAYALASARALLSLVGVLASLYAVGTVTLARLLLRERLRSSQCIDALLAFTGVLLIGGA